jgi:hypothetical protein
VPPSGVGTDELRRPAGCAYTGAASSQTLDPDIAVYVRSVDSSDVLANYDPNFTNPSKLGLVGLAGTVDFERVFEAGPDDRKARR